MTPYMREVVGSLGLWIGQRCVAGADTSPGELYSAYAKWQAARRSPIGTPSANAVGVALRLLGYHKRKSNGVWLYCGITIKRT